MILLHFLSKQRNCVCLKNRISTFVKRKRIKMLNLDFFCFVRLKCIDNKMIIKNYLLLNYSLINLSITIFIDQISVEIRESEIEVTLSLTFGQRLQHARPRRLK